VGSGHWGTGRLREALRSGLASGRIRRVGRDRFTAADDGVTPSGGGGVGGGGATDDLFGGP